MICACSFGTVVEKRVILRVLYAAVGILIIIDTFLAVALERFEIIMLIVGAVGMIVLI